jgi:hypothetical protein
MIDKHEVSIVKTDELSLVQDFANTFYHQVKVSPVHLINVDGITLGYLELVPKMIVYPSLHPRLFTPRLFHEVGWKVLDGLKRSFGDPWIAESPIAPLGARRLGHIGLKPLDTPIYRVAS